jgi:hypothetical protein
VSAPVFSGAAGAGGAGGGKGKPARRVGSFSIGDWEKDHGAVPPITNTAMQTRIATTNLLDRGDDRMDAL